MASLTNERSDLCKGSSHLAWLKPPALLWSIKSRVSVPVMWLKCVLRNRGSPSPSSLMDFGSDTAKHCIVSYFCCASWSCVSSASLWGFTSMRQLKVWLFRRGFSLDHGTPFTVGGMRRDITLGHSSEPAFPNFSLLNKGMFTLTVIYSDKGLEVIHFQWELEMWSDMRVGDVKRHERRLTMRQKFTFIYKKSAMGVCTWSAWHSCRIYAKNKKLATKTICVYNSVSIPCACQRSFCKPITKIN